MVEKEVLDYINDILDIVVKKEKRRIKSYNYYHNKIEQERKRKAILQEKNKEKYDEYYKEYRKGKNFKKSCRISQWKARGLKCDNYDALYQHYLKTAYCDACKVLLTCDKEITATTKCMDHCHISGLFRNILCQSCNVKRA
jgi:hypothetical protein